MATASHAAGLELRQTVWVMQALGQYGLGDWEGLERYRLVSTVALISTVTLSLQVPFSS
jgi:predicted component of type VI protein secretion system